jgi:hypothetical protein
VAVASLIRSPLSQAAPLRTGGDSSRLATCCPLPLSSIHSAAPSIVPARAADAARTTSCQVCARPAAGGCEVKLIDDAAAAAFDLDADEGVAATAGVSYKSWHADPMLQPFGLADLALGLAIGMRGLRCPAPLPLDFASAFFVFASWIVRRS